MSVVRRFVGGAMNLAQSIQDFVQAGRSLFAAFKWLLLLTGSGAPKSGVDRRVIWALFLVLAFVFITPWLPVVVPYFGMLGSLVPSQASQLSSLVQKRVIRLVRASIVLDFSWPRCLASHSSRILCLKATRASASGQSTI